MGHEGLRQFWNIHESSGLFRINMHGGAPPPPLTPLCLCGQRLQRPPSPLGKRHFLGVNKFGMEFGAPQFDVFWTKTKAHRVGFEAPHALHSN